MNPQKIQKSRLASYLAVTAGLGCTTTAASGSVIFYGINSANDTNPDPPGINIGTWTNASGYTLRVLDSTYSYDTEFLYSYPDGHHIKDGIPLSKTKRTQIISL